MQIRVETADQLPATATRSRVEERVRFVMRRMRAQVMLVHVRQRQRRPVRGASLTRRQSQVASPALHGVMGSAA